MARVTGLALALALFTSAACRIDDARRVDSRWTCGRDSDCINSCARGAVNRGWHERHPLVECDDGCADSDTAAARCVDRLCRAYRFAVPFDGVHTVPRPECTMRGP